MSRFRGRNRLMQTALVCLLLRRQGRGGRHRPARSYDGIYKPEGAQASSPEYMS